MRLAQSKFIWKLFKKYRIEKNYIIDRINIFGS